MDTTNTTLRAAMRYTLVAGLVCIVGACASSKVTRPDTDQASTMIRQAEEAGAQEYAPLELRNAREKIEQAKALVSEEEYAKATRLTEEASVDAELAMIKARSEKAQEAVEQIRETIETLKEEIKRNQANSGGQQ